MPRVADPAVRSQLVAAAARLLAAHGREAVTARRLAAEVGTSTQAVYTHFAGVDGVVAEVWRAGFRRIREVLDEPARTADPVADWMVQGWSFRRFARTDPHLYRAMFTDDLLARRPTSRIDPVQLFAPRLERIRRCRDSGRWEVPDLISACEVSWATVHGVVMIELGGYFEDAQRDGRAGVAEVLRRIALGYGDDPALVERSIQAARRRDRRAELGGKAKVRP